MAWFSHAVQLINFIEIGHRGEIRGSVLPGTKVTLCFCFKLGLVLITSDCGITAECGVDKSVNTSAVHVCTFYETRPLCKNAKCDAYTVFVAQTFTICVATAGDFSLDLGFSCFIWCSGVFIENLGIVSLWSNFTNVCCITVFSNQDYSSFIGVMCRVSTVEQG